MISGVGATVSQNSLLRDNTDRLGMYCILVPVLATPIIVILWRGTRLTRVRRVEYQANKAAHKRSFKASCMSIFWQVRLDFENVVVFVYPCTAIEPDVRSA